MAIEFDGSDDELRSLVEANGFVGDWTADAGKLTFRAKRGGVINYWAKTGRVQCQGPADKKLALEAIFSPPSKASTIKPAIASVIENTKPADSRTKIFVVHGHDQTTLEQLELVLRRLNLDPYILQNNTGQSRTIIEALEQQIYKEAAFGIVLMTPDDFGYVKTKSDTERQARARQNVVLEMGMVFASLGRDRMVILKKGALEMPSDVGGLLYLEFNEHVKEVAVRLAVQMKSAGITIDDALVHAAGV